MGSFPHELPGYRHVEKRTMCANCSNRSGGSRSTPEPGLRIPNMLDAAVDGTFKGLYCQGEGTSCNPTPDTKHVAAGLAAMDLCDRP